MQSSKTKMHNPPPPYHMMDNSSQEPRFILESAMPGHPVGEYKKGSVALVKWDDYLIDSDQPTLVYCPNCRAVVLTETKSRPGQKTYIWCGLLWLCFGVFGGLIPCCIPSCKDVVHKCPTCNCTIALYERSSKKSRPTNGTRFPQVERI